MTQSSRTIVSRESVLEGVEKWAWIGYSAMIRPEGGRIKEVSPATQRSRDTGVSAPRLQVVPHASGTGNSYLLNVRAGWTPLGNVPPTELMKALEAIDPNRLDETNKPYLMLKNKFQITLSFNGDLESHAAVLDQLSPAWRLAKTNTAIQLRRGILLDIQGIKFASDDKGGLLFKKDGTCLYNFAEITVSQSVLDMEVDAVGSRTTSTRVAIDNAAAMKALGISVSVDEAFNPAPAVGAAPVSRAAAPAIAALGLKKALKEAGHEFAVKDITPLLNLGYSIPEIVGYIHDDGASIEDIVEMAAA